MITCQYCNDPLTLDELPFHKDKCANWEHSMTEEETEEIPHRRFVKLTIGFFNISHIVRFGEETEDEDDKFFLVLAHERLNISEDDYLSLLKTCVGGV